MEELRDRILGSFVGKCLGDALGAPYEFRYNSHLEYTPLLTHRTRFLSRWTPERNLPPGQVTDDTEMTIALMRSIVERGGYDERDAADWYIDWANSGTFMIGNNTRKLFCGIKAKNREKRWDTLCKRMQKRFSQKEEEFQSNGSLMRASPLAVFASDEPALADCKLTNPSVVNCEASRRYVGAIRDCLRGERDKNKIYYHAGYSPLPDNGTSDLRKGWVGNAFSIAFEAFVRFQDFPSAMRWIIEEKKGDTDTNAAIAGALLGAYYGFDSLMQDPVTQQNWDTIRSVDTGEGDNPRPERYLPSVATDLIDGLHAVARKELFGQEETKKRTRSVENDFFRKRKKTNS